MEWHPRCTPCNKLKWAWLYFPACRPKVKTCNEWQHPQSWYRSSSHWQHLLWSMWSEFMNTGRKLSLGCLLWPLCRWCLLSCPMCMSWQECCCRSNTLRLRLLWYLGEEFGGRFSLWIFRRLGRLFEGDYSSGRKLIIMVQFYQLLVSHSQ